MFDWNNVQNFLTWVEKQPPYSTWDYFNCHKCPIASYLKDNKISFIRVGSTSVLLNDDDQSVSLVNNLDSVARAGRLLNFDHISTVTREEILYYAIGRGLYKKEKEEDFEYGVISGGIAFTAKFKTLSEAEEFAEKLSSKDFNSIYCVYRTVSKVRAKKVVTFEWS